MVLTLTAGKAVAEEHATAALVPPSSLSERFRPSFESALGKTSLGSYGEALYTNQLDEGHDEFDLARVVLFVAHEFNDWISVYSEIEVEHADTVELEQSFVELRPWGETAALRGGLLLIPLSYVNLYHEPVYFYSVERPAVDLYVVPSTFFAPGVSVSGRPLDWLDYELVLSTSLALADRSGELKTGTTDTEGIRGLKQGGTRASANDLAVSGRVTVQPALGLSVAASFFTGETGQDQKVQADDEVVTLPDARVTVVETDARYQVAGFDLRAQLAYTFFGDAGRVSELSDRTVGERQAGAYGEVSYDLLRWLADTDQRLRLFYRLTWIDLQSQVPEGRKANAAGRWVENRVGLAWFPIDEVVAKIDFATRSDDADETRDQLAAGIGYSF